MFTRSLTGVILVYDHNLWKSTKLVRVSLNLTFENKSSYFHIAHLFFGLGNQSCLAL